MVPCYHECLNQEDFSDIFGAIGAPNRMEKGMKVFKPSHFPAHGSLQTLGALFLPLHVPS